MAEKKEKKGVATAPRKERRVVTGVVVSDKMNKTISVKVARLVRHKKFGKYLRRFTTCKAHDEKNEAAMGDVVELMSTRRLSATKRWRLTNIVRKSVVPAAADAPAS